MIGARYRLVELIFHCRKYRDLATQAVQEEIRQLQFGIHPKFAISCGNDLAPITPIADAVNCEHTPSKYRIQGVVVGHWPANIAECMHTATDGTRQYAFVLRVARNAREPIHMDIEVVGAPAVSDV